MTSARKVMFMPLPPEQVDPACPGVVHGAHDSAYTHHGCRCWPAKRAYSRYRKELAAGLRGGQRPIPAAGTRRRLQALAAVGWTLPLIAADIAAHGAPVNDSTLWLIRSSQHDMVRPRIAEAVAASYDRLWDQPGPSSRTVANARRMQWPPPMWWDDDVIDNPKPCGPAETTGVGRPRRGGEEDQRAG
jgi:hypothetical protein